MSSALPDCPYTNSGSEAMMGDDTIPHAVSIQVTIVPDAPDNPDPASVSNAASNITEALNAAGYTTTAVSTGTKGDFLYALGQ